MSTLNTKLLARIQASKTTVLDAGDQIAKHEIEAKVTWPNGTASNKAETVYSDEGTVASGAFVNLDLTALVQKDADDNTIETITLTQVKAVMIKNTSTSGSIVIGGGTDGAAAADAWALTGGLFTADADKITIPAGAAFMWTAPAGVSVTNLTADIFCIAGVTAEQTYDIVIIGDIT